MNLLNEIRNDIEGAKLLSDWIGEGVPVRQEHATGRALVCIQGNGGLPCEHFTAPYWWERAFKNPIADIIRMELEIKNTCQLSTPADDWERMCRICGCCVSLKVWAPIDHIKAHTTPEMKSKFPPFCWQKREIEML